MVRFAGLLGFLCGIASALPSLAEAPTGIGPLIDLGRSPHSLVDADTRPLLTPEEVERFLKELDGAPPDWAQLLDRPGEELGARLFDFNRKRDAARSKRPRLLAQRIAFRWAGLLSRYSHEHGGFPVAVGPEFVSTRWGIVRFKPMGLPREMIAVTNEAQRQALLERLEQASHIEIGIVFIGHLVPDESIIYAFDHENPDQGLIMPIVQVEAVKYFLPAKHPSHP